VKLKVNSVDSLADAWLEVRKFYKDNRHFTLEFYTKRNVSQNALQHKWYSVIAKQTGETSDEVKCFCKLKFGFNIVLKRDDDSSRKLLDRMRFTDWDGLARKWGMSTYEVKLVSMQDTSMTSDFTKAEAMEYMNNIKNYYEPNGILLPTKEDEDYI